ncbi:MAG: helix-turn-helix transcriptional regulator, partial [Acidimicrobiales bacterium]
RATRLYSYAVNVAASGIDIDRAVALATRAAECGTRAGGLSVLSGTMATVEAGLLAGDPEVATRLAPLAHLADGLIETDLADAEHVFSLVVLADFALESWDRAERLLDLMERRARETGRLFLLAFALVIRSELDWRRGRWTEAYTRATTDVWETPLDLPWVGPWLHAVLARIEAGLGLTDEAREHGEAALAAARTTGTRAVEAWAGASLGFLELGQARPQAALEHLATVARTLEQNKVAEPGILWFASDLIEAHWRLGELGPARRALEALRTQAEATGRSWANAAVRRADGLLAPTPRDAEAAFADALAWHDRLPAPFERARTLLLLGERRRSFGLDDAEVPLHQARATFEHLGADPWTAQARRLSGEGGAPDASVALTRQERRVAAVVGTGATNREAADELFLSPRTIDFHLRNIYRKLDIRSRTELAVHVAAGSTRAGPTAGAVSDP